MTIKSEDNIHTVAMLLCYYEQRYYLNKLTRFEDANLSVVLTSPVRLPAMVLLMAVRN
jgi:hypothetical protein